MGNGASAEGDVSSGAVAGESSTGSAIGPAAAIRSGALTGYPGPNGQEFQSPRFKHHHVPTGGLQQRSQQQRRPPRLEQIEAPAGVSATDTSSPPGKRNKKKKKKKAVDQGADDDGGGPFLSTRGMAQRRP